MPQVLLRVTMTTVNNEYLSALALLKTAYDQHGTTYLDYVAPFVGDTIRSTGKSEIKTDELGAAIVDRYGLKIPKGVLNTLTRRLARRGFGYRAFGRFVPDLAKLRESYDFEEQRTECQRTINALAVSFIAFTEAKTGRNLSDLEAIAALIKYADSNGLPILSRAHEQTPLPISLSLDEMEYITSLFVIHAFEGSLPEKETLIMLAKGSKLASVLYFPDPKDMTRRITGLTALFDTPTLLSALGYQGTEKERAARDILDLANQSRIALAVFDHTIEEIQEVLQAASRRATQGSYYQRGTWGVDAHFLEVGYTASDIELLIGRLERDLRSLKVRVQQRPEFRVEWSVNETELEDKLQEKVRYPRASPRMHDLEALTATFRQRKGRRPTRFENCRAIFVTPNKPLAWVSKEFFQQEYGGHWPLAVTEDEFATLLWLKQPLAAPDLPERRVVADAYAALEPGFVCWESFLSELQKLRDNDRLSVEDYVLLRYSTASKDALMQETLGKPGALDANTVLQIRARVVDAIRTPIKDEVDQLTASLAEVEQKADEQQESFSTHLAGIEQQRDSARHELLQVHETQRRKAKRKATRWGGASRRILNTAAALLILLALWFAAPAEWELPTLPDFMALRWVARAAVVGLVFAKVGDLVFKWNISMGGRQLEVWVSKHFEQRYLLEAGLGELSEASTTSEI